VYSLLSRLQVRFERRNGDGLDRSAQLSEDRGRSPGFGALYRVTPLLAAGGEGTHLSKLFGRKNGERPTPFSFVQLSDSHVGFDGPPNPLGTRAFERAVDMINGLSQGPELVLFTGDLTHNSENPAEPATARHGHRSESPCLTPPAARA
jgi:hypothetical protein